MDVAGASAMVVATVVSVMAVLSVIAVLSVMAVLSVIGSVSAVVIAVEDSVFDGVVSNASSPDEHAVTATRPTDTRTAMDQRALCFMDRVRFLVLIGSLQREETWTGVRRNVG
jgi:hypothetical protein